MERFIMKLTVHGSRGSIPISSPQSVGYGGNTSCYELLFDDYQLIFDTGTGFRQVSIDQFKRTFIFFKPCPEIIGIDWKN